MSQTTILGAAFLAARATAFIMALLVVFESIGTISRGSAKIPMSDVRMALCWLIASLPIAIGTGYVILSSQSIVAGSAGSGGNNAMAFLLIWASIAGAFTTLSTMQAKRPKLIWLSAVGITVSGFVFSIIRQMHT